MFCTQPVKARGGGKEVQLRLKKLESLNYGVYYRQVYDFGMSRPGIEPVISSSPKQTLYQSYWGQFLNYSDVQFLYGDTDPFLGTFMVL